MIITNCNITIFFNFGSAPSNQTQNDDVGKFQLTWPFPFDQFQFSFSYSLLLSQPFENCFFPHKNSKGWSWLVSFCCCRAQAWTLKYWTPHNTLLWWAFTMKFVRTFGFLWDFSWRSPPSSCRMWHVEVSPLWCQHSLFQYATWLRKWSCWKTVCWNVVVFLFLCLELSFFVCTANLIKFADFRMLVCSLFRNLYGLSLGGTLPTVIGLLVRLSHLCASH